MGRWLDRLRKKTRKPSPRSLTKPTETLVMSSVSRQSKIIRKNTVDVRPVVDALDSRATRSVTEESTGPTISIRGVSQVASGRVCSTDWRGKATCWACRRALWWKDRYGNKKCGICHPPGNPDQIEWYDDQAEHFEERAAIIEHEAGLPQAVAEDLANKQAHRGKKRRKTQR
jgi:hypothetical protein